MLLCYRLVAWSMPWCQIFAIEEIVDLRLKRLF